MKRLRLKNLIAITVLSSLCLTACGKNDVVVEKYGTGKTEAQSEAGTGTDAEGKVAAVAGKGDTLRSVFGNKVTWKEEFSIDDIRFKADVSYSIPDSAGMNVYYANRINDGKSEEKEIVDSLFGDSAKKIEELKYTNQTDYISLIYKYRSLIETHDQYQKIILGEEYSWSENNVIDGPFDETYKWLDDNDLYIHMYEGMYDGKKFGLILAYDDSSKLRTIFLEPISIKEYFPDEDYKTLLVSGSNNMVGQPLDLKNDCSMNVDEVKKNAKDFLEKTIKLDINYDVTDNPAMYQMLNMNGLLLYASSSYYFLSDTRYSVGDAMLMFSDVDYISTYKSNFERGDIVEYKLLTEQRDLYKEYMEAHPDKTNLNNLEYVLSTSTSYNEGVQEANVTNDGYAVFLANDIFSEHGVYVGDGKYSQNRGIIKYTSNGFYGADLTLAENITDVTENVELLDFDKIIESVKSELPTKFDKNKMIINSKGVYITGMELSYTPYSDDENSSEYTYIPTWSFTQFPDGNGTGGAEFSINAIDGSLMDIYYFDVE